MRTRFRLQERLFCKGGATIAVLIKWLECVKAVYPILATEDYFVRSSWEGRYMMKFFPWNESHIVEVGNL